MNRHLTSLFWILADLLIVFSIPFFPSSFSIFCIITAILLAPIDPLQNFIKKHLNKSLKSAILAVSIAFVIAQFPLSPLVTGVYKLITPQNSSPEKTNSIVYQEEFSSDFSVSSNTEVTTSTKTLTSNESVSSVASKSNNTSSKNSTSKQISTSSNTSNISNSDSVYRTPSGKKYHNSPTCGGKNSYEVSYDEAIDAGLTPCKKCVKEK